MNEELLKKLLEYLQKTEDFALEQIPDIFLQALKYQKITTWSTAILMIILSLICATLAFYFYNNPQLDSRGDRTFLSFFIPIMAPFIGMFSFISLCYCVDKLINIYVAPKYYLICLIKSML